MSACPACGADIGTSAKFCPECGTRLTVVPTTEVRKTVTVVFCDVVGSTALGERLDPEVQRAVLTRYFDEMRRVLESHGGRVEKFIGDAVMAVFGVPVTNEDDALRAVRAAAEMQDVVRALAGELAPAYGVEFAVRIGVNTGEVVVGEGTQGTVATGDPVNTAARLEQEAQPGEVLIGEATHRLLPDAVVAEPVEPVTAKGKDAPVPAWRLVSVPSGTTRVERDADARLVGRARELRLLGDALDRAIEENICQLVTILGAAGAGKSRLVQEFLDGSADRALVLRGRCLSYGEGIAFWPLQEILRAGAGLTGAEDPGEARERLGAVLDDGDGTALLVDRIAPLIGLPGHPAGQEETRAAVRRYIEALAMHQPTVLVVDDVHWAEPPMLDLVVHLVDLIRDVPLLVLCVGRPEFLEQHAGWASGALNAATVNLAPLGEADVAHLVGELLADAPVDPDLVSTVSAAAGGNPLFVGQLVAMLRESGRIELVDGLWTIAGAGERLELPPTINALLAARLDRLPPAERSVLEAASVMGMVFYAGALMELLDSVPATPEALVGLLRRDFIRSAASDIAGEEGYRFLHVLVREATYAAIPKSSRAQLHDRFAGWLDERAAGLSGQFDDFIGFHLEQSYLLRCELGPVDDAARGIGDRASTHLAAAAQGLRLTDAAGAASRFARAAALTSDPRAQARLLLRSSQSLFYSGELVASVTRAEEALAVARSLDDEATRLACEVRLLQFGSQIGRTFDLDAATRLADDVVARFDPATDAELFVCAHALLTLVSNLRARWGPLLEAATRGVEHATRAGLADDVAQFRSEQAAALLYGPLPSGEGLPIVQAILDDEHYPAAHRSGVLSVKANLLAMADRPGEARETLQEGYDILAGRPPGLWRPLFDIAAGETEVILGDDERAMEFYRRGIEWLEANGERAWLSTYGAWYAAKFIERTGDVEARRLLDVCRMGGSPDDAVTQALLNLLEAVLHSRAGRHSDAVGRADEAVRWTGTTDQTHYQARVCSIRADIRLAAGDRAGAMEDYTRALELFEAKEDIPEARRARALVEELTSVASRD